MKGSGRDNALFIIKREFTIYKGIKAIPLHWKLKENRYARLLQFQYCYKVKFISRNYNDYWIKIRHGDRVTWGGVLLGEGEEGGGGGQQPPLADLGHDDVDGDPGVVQTETQQTCKQCPLLTCKWRYRWGSGCHTNWNITVTSARLSKCVGAATVRGNRLRKTRACTSEEGKEGELIPSPPALVYWVTHPRRCVRSFRLYRYIIRLSVCCQHWAAAAWLCGVRCGCGVRGL